MKNTLLFTGIFLLFTGAHAVTPAKHAAPPVAAKAAAPAAPKQQYQEVSYDDLAKYLNQHVVVRTTLHTERSGTLVKYSGTAIDLKLDTGATLGLPRETIRSIGIPIVPADAPVPEKK
jgi:hypothetical protein